MSKLDDIQERTEWIEAVNSVIAFEGTGVADDLLGEAVSTARRSGAKVPFAANSAYINTISTEQEPKHPGDIELESRIRAVIRWNAAAIVLRANKDSSELGGHIASFQSASMLYDTGFEHFWRAPTKDFGGDLIFYQGHSSPGIYARAFVEGRLSEEQLLNFRQEVEGTGLSSYPHPWLMPNFWQFPTVSMGLGPIMSIYLARFMKYLHHRGLADTSNRKIWVFCGDGEMDEPESLGAISLAGREKLDNLIFVINCNLQRLDGPVRGNGKIVQELEGNFRGTGWNVIKVLWGSGWDELLANDHTGRLRQLMEECVDGDYQDFRSKDGAYVREKFFGRYPETASMVADWSDERIWALTRGGHDTHKVFSAYKSASTHIGQPTLILAKTVKGYGMGEAGEGQMISHQAKKMDDNSLRQFRDRFNIPVKDSQLPDLPFVKLPPGSPEEKYLHDRRAALGGYLPQRRLKADEVLEVPPLETFKAQLESSGERQISSTMTFVRILNSLLRNKSLGKRIVPIVPDESRTFGMEGMFRQYGIFSQVGQLYQPQDADQLMYYKEDKTGQMLQEGINEAGAMSSWIAAATSYSTSNVMMVPFYIFYSMFGFQRIHDLAWAAGDSRARGFLIGATAGRTTLNGEGLQHEDGHSHLFASTIPNCVSYDPTYGYEIAVIVRDGLRRMVSNQEDVFYYITVMNENYQHPAMPEGSEEGIIKGIYKLRAASAVPGQNTVKLIGSGAILNEVIAGAKLLEQDFKVSSDIYSVTSFNELSREAASVNRWNLLNPEKPSRVPYVTQVLSKGCSGPVIASTDYIKLMSEQLRAYIKDKYYVLGTDGFGRSDYRRKLRSHFEVDRYFVVINALKALADEGKVSPKIVSEALRKYNINSNKPDPVNS
ncbi:MAG: Pyruvate dehydrogenase E1 component [Hyphomicrobiaceae bacterium hypho_1]